MNGTEAEIGQWYASADKGEVFQVVGRDEEADDLGYTDTAVNPAAPFIADVPEADERPGP